jgi:hypothetical protein
MHDFGSGLEMSSFAVTATFPIDGVSGGENLASRFKSVAQGVREWKLSKPVPTGTSGQLAVTVKDKQGNETRIERSVRVP